MTDISKNVLEKIKSEKVRPYTRWHFVFKRSFIWAMFVLSIVLGSVASGIFYLHIWYAEWEFYTHISHSLLEFLIVIIPYFWVFFMVGFAGFSYYYFRRTEQGYTYETLLIVLGSILLSLLGGGLFSVTSIPAKIESIFADNVPFYSSIEDHRHKVWMMPENGLLAGSIVQVISENEIMISDLDNHPWTIDISNTVWKGRLTPVKQVKIKIIGKMTVQGRFIAQEIRPWNGRKYRMGRGRQGFQGPNRGRRGMGGRTDTR